MASAPCLGWVCSWLKGCSRTVWFVSGTSGIARHVCCANISCAFLFSPAQQSLPPSPRLSCSRQLANSNKTLIWQDTPVTRCDSTPHALDVDWLLKVLSHLKFLTFCIMVHFTWFILLDSLHIWLSDPLSHLPNVCTDKNLFKGTSIRNSNQTKVYIYLNSNREFLDSFNQHRQGKPKKILTRKWPKMTARTRYLGTCWEEGRC